MTSIFNNEKVLVTVGSGFVGTNLIKRLSSLGARVRTTTHKKPPVFKGANIEYVTCDLTKKEDCKKASEGMDYIFM